MLTKNLFGLTFCPVLLERALDQHFEMCVSVSVTDFQASDWSKVGDLARCRETSYDVVRLLLMVLLEPWQNSTPFLDAAAFCTTKIDDFRASLTTWSTHSSKRRSLRWTSFKRQIMEVFEVDQLKETNNGRLRQAMPNSGQLNLIRLMEDNLYRMTTFDGRQPSTEDEL